VDYSRFARRIALVVACLLHVLLLSPRAGAATPEEERNSCVDQYSPSSFTPFTCTVCGVEAGCTSVDDCYWGSLSVEPSSSGLIAAFVSGFQIYCVNRGGSLLASSSPIGSQGQILDRALSGTRRDAGQMVVGGILEYAAFEGGGSTEGIAAPISKNVSWSSREMDLDLSGSLMFANGEAAQQYGITAHPTLRFFPGGGSPAPGTRAVFGTALPLQLLILTGDGLETSAIYHAGLGGIAGVVTESGLGAGFAIDAIYASGIQLPLQLVGRWSTPFQGGALAIQPAISSDAISGGSILDTLQQNVMAGWDSGSWMFGLRVFRQGDDAWVFGLGVNYASRASELAAGTSDAYQRTAQQTAPGQAPQGAAVPASPPQEALEALLLVDAAGDVTESARTRAALTDVLRGRAIEPMLRTEVDRVLAQTAPMSTVGGLTPAQMEAARQGMRADLVVWVTAQRLDAVNARMQLMVFGRGLRARRELVVPFEAVSRAAAESVAALLTSFDVRGLSDQVAQPPERVAPGPAPPVVPPPTVPPPPPPPPVAPPPLIGPDAPAPPNGPDPYGETPPSTAPPPTEASPPDKDGCAKDTDCKGDRICENGKCVNPPKRPR
jgi:hypothetical protein